MNKKIEEFYNSVGSGYSENWGERRKGMEIINKFEKAFIEDNLNDFIKLNNKKIKVLNVGTASGRICEILLKNSLVEYYGLDISGEMVNIVKNKFQSKKNFFEIKQCDISQGITYENKMFDFISCVRVLKYNDNWKEILADIFRILKKDGEFCFSMPNCRSFNFFSKGPLNMYKTNKKELIGLLRRLGFRDIEFFRGFKIPDFFYSKVKSNFCIFFLNRIEMVLNFIFKDFFTKLFYIRCKK